MTPDEINALCTDLSNEARVIYCLYLRPQLSVSKTLGKNSENVTINNKEILSLLNKHHKTVSLGRELSAFFKELHDAGLIEITGTHSFERSLNKHQAILKLVTQNKQDGHKVHDEASLIEDDSFHQNHQKMTLHWRPSLALFTSLSELTGLITKEYSADELGEFIAYWLGRPEVQFTEYQWAQKFVVHLKRRRMHQSSNAEQNKMGHQWVDVEAGIEFDENVKALVDKYSKNNHSE
ncbi:DnaT-like ssDNA-binding domain-containing protein [Ningiella sp. W23]|uniref:DnaT-like ssDNA-binding domain-containing protein n=1 Tax=Ningiella sp. W23 TaxID=3023715 RepID=UPI003757CC2C